MLSSNNNSKNNKNRDEEGTVKILQVMQRLQNNDTVLLWC